MTSPWRSRDFIALAQEPTPLRFLVIGGYAVAALGQARIRQIREWFPEAIPTAEERWRAKVQVEFHLNPRTDASDPRTHRSAGPAGTASGSA